jgi:hypothetical protein
MPAHAVLRKGTGRKETALLGEVLEGAPRKEMAPDVAALDAVDAGQDDEIGVRAEDVERIELDAAQPFERRTHAARATTQRTVEGMVRDERTSCLGAGKGEGRHAGAMVTGAVRLLLVRG